MDHRIPGMAGEEDPPTGLEEGSRVGRILTNLLLLPLRLLWNFLVTLGIIALAVAWWGFLFGSGVVFILALIFAPSLFLVPILPAAFYTELWPEDE